PSPADDFAKAPQMVAVEPTVSLRVDETAWKKTLEDVTGLYKQYPDVQSVTASARFSAINEYMVNSEGTVTRCGKTTYSVQLSSSAQAADGMRLSRSPAFMVARAEELPTREALIGEAKKCWIRWWRCGKRRSSKRNTAGRCCSRRMPRTTLWPHG